MDELKIREKEFDPGHDVLSEYEEHTRKFLNDRRNSKVFKPMKVAPVHHARCCFNCAYRKSLETIDQDFSFSGYGQAFYFGFIACALNGRTPEDCMVTDKFAVCSHHKFADELKGCTRMPPKPLKHLARCIDERIRKGESGNKCAKASPEPEPKGEEKVVCVKCGESIPISKAEDWEVSGSTRRYICPSCAAEEAF